MLKVYNLGIFGPNKVGKTLFVEALLYKTGMIEKFGGVNGMPSTMDYDKEEIERGMGINLSVGYIKKGNDIIYLLDTPGYMDFIGEQVAGLEVCDIAVLVISSGEGISTSAEKLWEMIREKKKPVIIFVNKLDASDVSFDSVWKEMTSVIGKNLLSVTVPVYQDGQMKGVENILEKKSGDNPSLQGYFQQAMDVIAELDDALMERYLEGADIFSEDISGYIKKGFIEGKLIPVFSGASINQTGIDEFISFVLKYLPSTSEMPPVKVLKDEKEDILERKEEGPLLSIIAKTIIDPFAGKLSYLRVFSGKLKSNSQCLNSTKNTKERIGQLMRIQGKKQEMLSEAGPGEVVAIAKISSAQAFDTFCEPSNPVKISVSPLPEGAVSYSIKPKVKGTEDKLGNAIGRIAEEDPTIRVFRDEETGETIISGMGDLHIDIAVNKFKEKFGVEVEKGIPKIAYKETITTTADAEGKHKKQTGGRGQYGHCFIKVEPLPRGTGFEFVDEIVGGAIPRQFIPSVEKGVREAMKKGVLAHYPVVDIRVRLYDGTYHTVDSSDIAFQLAGILALQKALQQANPVLLEPIVNVEIMIPQEFVGDVIGTINAKRGRVLDMVASGRNHIVKAQVPLAEMANYTNELRSITSGSGTYTMAFSHYEEVPNHIATKIIEERKKEREARQ
ncbi:MAG: elongation factor G [Candidatus Omnitrophica bacterium]|nr:elongation factor G [Candidatus Omnitrophota bacterium]